MITNIQSVDLKRFGIEEVCSGGTGISLSGEERITYVWTMGGMGGNSEDHVGNGRGSRIERENAERENYRNNTGHLRVGIETLILNSAILLSLEI